MEWLDSYSEKITQGCIIDGIDWGNGNVDIHPADDQSKQLVQFCQENNII